MTWTKGAKIQLNKYLHENGLKHLKHEVFNRINQGATADEIISFIDEHQKALPPPKTEIELSGFGEWSYTIFGKHLIDQNAIDDMDAAMRLPYATEGALMPDAHRVAENHIPVGGVILSDTAIVPGWVGADISCSVGLTVTDIPMENAPSIEKMRYLLKVFSYFNQQVQPDNQAVKQRRFYQELPTMRTRLGQEVLNNVLKIAPTQFGTSGDGNHFVEFGDYNGKLAILSHFGSRNVGATIANAFIQYANDQVIMPAGMLDAPLGIDSPHGKDYYYLMQWAGEFAQYGHEHLHQTLRWQLDVEDSWMIYTRHNYAWLEPNQGMVHRKGATPADNGMMGVIPATMGDNTLVVRGLGNERSLWSTSHGAGRTHSRTRALQEFGGEATADYVLRTFGVHLIGGGADEDPRAYKRVQQVMDAQSACATVVGHFKPIVVRMAEPRMPWRKKK